MCMFYLISSVIKCSTFSSNLSIAGETLGNVPMMLLSCARNREMAFSKESDEFCEIAHICLNQNVKYALVASVKLFL